jgi:hypothetical protein
MDTVTLRITEFFSLDVDVFAVYELYYQCRGALFAYAGFNDRVCLAWYEKSVILWFTGAMQCR